MFYRKKPKKPIQKRNLKKYKYSIKLLIYKNAIFFTRYCRLRFLKKRFGVKSIKLTKFLMLILSKIHKKKIKKYYLKHSYRPLRYYKKFNLWIRYELLNKMILKFKKILRVKEDIVYLSKLKKVIFYKFMPNKENYSIIKNFNKLNYFNEKSYKLVKYKYYPFNKLNFISKDRYKTERYFRRKYRRKVRIYFFFEDRRWCEWGFFKKCFKVKSSLFKKGNLFSNKVWFHFTNMHLPQLNSEDRVLFIHTTSEMLKALLPKRRFIFMKKIHNRKIKLRRHWIRYKWFPLIRTILFTKSTRSYLKKIIKRYTVRCLINELINDNQEKPVVKEITDTEKIKDFSFLKKKMINSNKLFFKLSYLMRLRYKRSRKFKYKKVKFHRFVLFDFIWYKWTCEEKQTYIDKKPEYSKRVINLRYAKLYRSGRRQKKYKFSRSSKSLFYIKNLNLLVKKIPNSMLVFRCGFLTKKYYKRTIVNLYTRFKDTVSKKIKKKRKKVFAFNFWKKKLLTYNRARRVHWGMYTKKTLKKRRYDNFLPKFLNVKPKVSDLIIAYFSFKFKFSLVFWQTFTEMYLYFFHKEIIVKNIYQLPISFRFWGYLKKNQRKYNKSKIRIKRWIYKNRRVRRRFWMRKKKKLPKFFFKQKLYSRSITSSIQYDFRTNYFVILKNKTINFLNKNDLAYNSKMLKLNNIRYKV